MRTDELWYDAVASGDGGTDAAEAAAPQERQGDAAVYLAVQRSDAFQQVRRRYRRFALPATAAFLVWYLAYVGTATVAPELMARPLLGIYNVGMAAGLGQFAGAFLLTWAYVRHARRQRDGLALELRWETQELSRVHADTPASGTAGEGTR